VVARSLPQHLGCPGWFLPGRVGMRTAIWRQKLVDTEFCRACRDFGGTLAERN